jgi:hypothetical protein
LNYADIQRLLERDDKTELIDQYSDVAVLGDSLGIPSVRFWNRAHAMSNNYRPYVAKAILRDLATGQMVSPESPVTRRWLPNRLEQQFTVGALSAREVRFVRGAACYDLITFTNEGREPVRYRVAFKGTAERASFYDSNRETPLHSFNVSETPDGFLVEHKQSYNFIPDLQVKQAVGCSEPLTLKGVGYTEGDAERMAAGTAGERRMLGRGVTRKVYAEGEGPASISSDRPIYVFGFDLELGPGESRKVALWTAFQGPHTEKQDVPYTVEAIEALLAKVEAEWEAYLTAGVPHLKAADQRLEQLWYHVWYIVRANRVKGGAWVPQPYAAPSKFFYWGCWHWDSAFHVMGERWLRSKETATNSVDAVMAMQLPNGYIQLCSGPQYTYLFTTTEDFFAPGRFFSYEEAAHPYQAKVQFWHNGQLKAFEMNEKTQTPIISHAAWQLYETTGDRAYLERTYRAIAAYDEWIHRRRQNGDELFIGYHGDESGWDNGSRHYPWPFKAVDINSHLYMQRVALARMAGELGLFDEAARWQDRAERTAEAIQKTFWQQGDGFYHDTSEFNVTRPQKAASGFMPLMAGIATAEQAASLVEHLHNPKEFASGAPLPSLSLDDPGCNPQGWGWNGPMWIMLNWQVMDGLMRYGFAGESLDLWEKTLGSIMKNGYPRCSELYNAVTGEPIAMPDYSWHAVLNDFVITRLAGLTVEGGQVTVAPQLPEGCDSLELEGIAVRGATLDLSVRREDGTLRVAVKAEGAPVTIAAHAPAGLRLAFTASGAATEAKA